MIFIPEDRSILFSRHALIRMNQRRISPNEVMRALSFGKVSLSKGKKDGEEDGRAWYNLGKHLLIIGFTQSISRRTIATVFFGSEESKIPGGNPCLLCMPSPNKVLAVDRRGRCLACAKTVVKISKDDGLIARVTNWFNGGS